MKKARAPINLFIILFLAVASAGAALQIRPASVAQAAPIPPTIGWIAFNDCNHISGDLSTNITTYNCGKTAGSKALVNYVTGTNLPVSVAIVAGDVASNDAGVESVAGTDAYNSFHNYVSTTGTLQFTDSDGIVNLLFSGLDTSRTYTFATTANDPTRTSSGKTSFVIWGVSAATNTSTSGATISNTVFNGDTTTFNTQTNTSTGYIARWTNIHPGIDGRFAVTIYQTGSTASDGPSAFVLQQSPYPTVTTITPGPTSGVLDPVISTTGFPSDTDTFTCGGTSLLGDILVSATDPYQVSVDDINFSPTLTLITTDGVVSPTTIYVRLNSATAGDFSGTVTCTSLGTTDKSATISGTAEDPILTITGTLDNFVSYPGVDSDEQTYTVAGSYLSTDLVVTAPTGFEVSLTSGTGFGPSVDIAPVDMSIPTTTIYVHLLQTKSGYAFGNITNVTSAVEEDQPVSGLTYWMSYTPLIQFNPIVLIQSQK